MESGEQRVLNRIKKYLRDLDALGLLPPYYYWRKDKIDALEKVDDKLLDEFVDLHQKYASIPDQEIHWLYEKIEPLLQTLKKDLETLKNEPLSSAEHQNQESSIINQILERIRPLPQAFQWRAIEELSGNDHQLIGEVVGFIQNIIGATQVSIKAFEQEKQKFGQADALIVLDREGRTPYYAISTYARNKGIPIPKPDCTFFIKTSGIAFVLEHALEDVIVPTRSRPIQNAPSQGEIHLTKALMAEFVQDLQLPEEAKSKIQQIVNSRGMYLFRAAEAAQDYVQKNYQKQLSEVSAYYTQALTNIKSGIRGTAFHTVLTKISTKNKPTILILDASICDGKQIYGTVRLLKDIYGHHLTFDTHITTSVLYGNSYETPLIGSREFLKLMPTNILTNKGFHIDYKIHQNEITSPGFMQNDTIGRTEPDAFVNLLKELITDTIKEPIKNEEINDIVWEENTNKKADMARRLLYIIIDQVVKK